MSNLTARVIPCLDIKDGRVVKGVNFVNLVDAGDPVESAAIYEENLADELCFLDITASSDRREILLHLVERIAEKIFIPFTVGGGIRTVDDVKAVLEKGADKVSINTAAFQNPKLLTYSSETYGSQCIVCAIDVKHEKERDRYEVFYTEEEQQPEGRLWIGLKRPPKKVLEKFYLRLWIEMELEMGLIFIF